MNYWVIQNGVKLGPLSEAQVRALHLSVGTPVWRTGLPDWTTAEMLEELAGTISPAAIPPIPAAGQYQPSYTAATGIDEEAHEIAEPGERPASYLAWSIVVTLLCCTPIGIVAIVYSALTDSRWRNGDFRGAHRASEAAQMWIIASIVLGLISMPFQIISMML